MNRNTLRHWLSLLLRVGITAVLLWYVFGKVDFEALRGRALDFSLGLIAIAVLILGAQVLAGAIRWRKVIHGIHGRLPFATVFQLMFVGMFFNQALPSAIGGDAMRVWHVYRYGLPLRAAFNSVLLDRVIAMAALLLVMLAGLPWLFRLVDSRGIRLAVIIAAVLMAAGLLALYLLKFLPAALTRWRIIRALQNLSKDLHALIAAPGIVFPVVALSLLLHVMTTLVIYAIARSLGLGIGVVECLVLVPPVILLTILPISLAGWGVRELGMISALGYAGISSSDALLISITFGVLIVLVSLPGGWLWLTKKYHQPHAELSYSDVAAGKAPDA